MTGSFGKQEESLQVRGPRVRTCPDKLFIFQYGMHPLTKVPVPGYLIEMTDGRRVLIDTGFPPSPFGPTREVHWFRVTPEDHVLRRLSSMGLQPTDIDWVICSHFDPDHCGGNDMFPHAKFFVQRRHYETAISGAHWRFEINRSHWDHATLEYLLIDGDEKILPGISLIDTSGHVPGHQSVMIELQSSRKVLLAVDALSTAATLNTQSRMVHAFDMDAEATRRSIAKLRSLIRDEGIAQVVYGHDAIQWPDLQKAPYAYV
ncbi:MAG TPA: N-acyl homoserine lactonase family protein [Candidatus Angelobacter sp.]|nr:N-acyl homoserine lactonase family protein [Candidatus Angelobacter sp.]